MSNHGSQPQTTINNYYYSVDSHNVTSTTLTNTYHYATENHDTVTDTVHDLTSSVVNDVTSTLNDVGTAVGDLTDTALSLVDGHGLDAGEITGAVSPLVDDVTTVVGDVLDTVTGADSTSFGGVLDAVPSTVDTVLTGVGDTLGSLSGDSGVTNVTGFVDSVPSAVETATSDIGHLGESLVGAGDGGPLTTTLSDVGDALTSGAVGDGLPSDTGTVVDSIIQTLSGAADIGSVAGDVGASVPAATEDVGNIVANIASFDPSNPTGSLDLADAGHTAIADVSLHAAAATPTDGVIADATLTASAPDMSDVGALLHAAASDVAVSSLDLDHLTSTVDLFDLGHVDTAMDTTHHS
jgi:hypothetical protein